MTCIGFNIEMAKPKLRNKRQAEPTLPCRRRLALLLLAFIVTAPFSPAQPAAGTALAVRAKSATAALTSHQSAQGYWITTYTSTPRFQGIHQEMNTFLTSMIDDIVAPVAPASGLERTLQRARTHLAGQIEEGGLVRYHGRPNSPTIGPLGCRITPDTDDTALVWRIAPGTHRELLPRALATLRDYRTPEGLYLTWLAPKDRFECIDPGKDPNPPDVAIQMNLYLFLAQADPVGARALCGALGRTIAEERIWVYYRIAPLIPFLRRADLKQAGCELRMPPSRWSTAAPGQDQWVAAVKLLDRLRGGVGGKPTSAEVAELLEKLAKDDFAELRRNPPLLYHNDFSASTPRFYWSEDFGYALWLRLYFDNVNRR